MNKNNLKDYGLVYESRDANEFSMVNESLSGQDIDDGILLRCRGVYATMGVMNDNQHKYNKANYDAVLKPFLKLVARKSAYGALEHKPSTTILMDECNAIRIDSVEWDEATQSYVGDICIMDTDDGKILASRAKSGSPIFLSSRALGKVQSDGTVMLSKFITFDAVGQPGFGDESGHPAEFSIINESLAYIPFSEMDDDEKLIVESMINETEGEFVNEQMSESELKSVDRIYEAVISKLESKHVNENLVSHKQEILDTVADYIANDLMPQIEKRIGDVEFSPERIESLINDTIIPKLFDYVSFEEEGDFHDKVLTPMLKKLVTDAIEDGDLNNIEMMDSFITMHLLPEIKAVLDGDKTMEQVIAESKMDAFENINEMVNENKSHITEWLNENMETVLLITEAYKNEEDEGRKEKFKKAIETLNESKMIAEYLDAELVLEGKEPKDGIVVSYKETKDGDGDKFTPTIRYNSSSKEFSADFGTHSDYYKKLADAKSDMDGAGFKGAKVVNEAKEEKKSGGKKMKLGSDEVSIKSKDEKDGNVTVELSNGDEQTVDDSELSEIESDDKKDEEKVNEALNTRLNKKVKKDLDAYFKGISGSDPILHHGLKHILIGALTDANFHSEAKKVDSIFPKAKKSKYYGNSSMEDLLEQNHGVPIAKSSKWDGHDIIDAIAFFASMTIGGEFGAKISELKKIDESYEGEEKVDEAFNPEDASQELLDFAELVSDKIKYDDHKSGDSKALKLVKSTMADIDPKNKFKAKEVLTLLNESYEGEEKVDESKGSNQTGAKSALVKEYVLTDSDKKALNSKTSKMYAKDGKMDVYEGDKKVATIDYKNLKKVDESYEGEEEVVAESMEDLMSSIGELITECKSDNALGQVRTQFDDQPFVVNMPTNFKSVWEEMTNESRSILSAQASHRDIRNTHDAYKFWSSRDFEQLGSDVSAKFVNESIENFKQNELSAMEKFKAAYKKNL